MTTTKDKIIIEKQKCDWCGYEWYPRSTSGFTPVQCPRCHKYLNVDL